MAQVCFVSCCPSKAQNSPGLRTQHAQELLRERVDRKDKEELGTEEWVICRECALFLVGGETIVIGVLLFEGISGCHGATLCPGSAFGRNSTVIPRKAGNKHQNLY